MFVKKNKDMQGINAFSDEIKEKSILYNFPKDEKNTYNKNFLYCDPPEVILQSK